jgi:alanine racemase
MHTFRTLQHSVLQIDLGAIGHNCGVIRNHIGNQCKLCAVVKADGYGLGALSVASQLQQHADLLAVYSPEEAGDLIVGGISKPILILAPVHSVDRFHPIYSGLAKGNIHLVVHGEDHLDSLETLAKRFGVTLNVQLKIDTGLHRGGCDMNQAKSIIERIENHSSFRLSGLMTHFISAVQDEELTRLQHDRFDSVLQSLEFSLSTDCLIHEANTAATVQWPWTHRNMVRVGLAWTGAVPSGVTPLHNILPVVSWRTRLAHVRQVQAGERVGYSGKWKAPRVSRIGVVPVGYASGYPMGVGGDGSTSGAFVKVFDEQFQIPLRDAPVIGSVSMDQIVIDLTDIPESGVGCGIELISTDTSSQANLEQIAKVAGVVPHAILSRISPKVHRTYLAPSVVESSESVTPLETQSVS